MRNQPPPLPSGPPARAITAALPAWPGAQTGIWWRQGERTTSSPSTASSARRWLRCAKATPPGSPALRLTPGECTGRPDVRAAGSEPIGVEVFACHAATRDTHPLPLAISPIPGLQAGRPRPPPRPPPRRRRGCSAPAPATAWPPWGRTASCCSGRSPRRRSGRRPGRTACAAGGG